MEQNSRCMWVYEGLGWGRLVRWHGCVYIVLPASQHQSIPSFGFKHYCSLDLDYLFFFFFTPRANRHLYKHAPHAPRADPLFTHSKKSPNPPGNRTRRWAIQYVCMYVYMYIYHMHPELRIDDYIIIFDLGRGSRAALTRDNTGGGVKGRGQRRANTTE